MTATTDPSDTTADTADTADTANARTARFDTAALITLPVRLVVGWTYFSAFWRRVALEDKLNPDLPGYIGEKFNHFLPNALGIGPIIEHLLTHPGLLQAAMTVFTIAEGLVGAAIMLGLCTRLMSVGVFSFAFGILLSAGWLGTTCLDEWQIGILGVAAGFMLFLSGGGRYSLDRLLVGRRPGLGERRWFAWLASGPIPLRTPAVLGTTAAIAALTLFTNQFFHGGVYGPLHNKSVAPRIEITDATLTDDTLRFQLYRTEGADVYGAFLIGLDVLDTATGQPLLHLDGDDLAALDPAVIDNRYLAPVAPGAHALVVPLGAKAQLTLPSAPARPGHDYALILTDVSGAAWQHPVELRAD
ncbi:quinol oxidase [Mycobacterium koreense]|uniref:Quinol oxidase n=1 Tax=Mycolicibacillus koreensis TaxID=1069220 RepID=A0A7I7SDY3_9MYCO|nr:TQO small subunit DoxD [Mycolicibacillus koreensis]MCV7248200.1 quinol oxidase [Mycolicibacillus koreensis]OSC33818.1 quinol oxidase [Mycolicibacillus koreensis]BBY55137.1 putative terminal quinol oxidase, subunit I [Mycolicibacillus koreensis]